MICGSGLMKSGRLLLPFCSGGTARSSWFSRQGLGLPSRPSSPPTSEMSPTGTWICFPLGLWWRLSRSCNPLTLFGSSVLILCIGLPWWLYLHLLNLYILLVVMCLLLLLLHPLFSSAFRPRELQKPYTRESLVGT